MKVLHLLRTEPDEKVRVYIEASSIGHEPKEVPLFEATPDYPELVEEIFASDRVICWW